MDEDLFDQVKVFLPKYLTPTNARELFSELEKFPQNQNYYDSNPPDELLQGDGWRGLVAINFESLAKRALSGVIVSNSCDINPKNQRAVEVRALFCPIIRLSAYTKVLENAGKTPMQIDSTLATIRLQRTTSIFYLPEYDGFMDESMIVLDDVHAHPLPDFIKQERSRLFSLNMYAFYIFVIKLSIHFTRFQENVQRSTTPLVVDKSANF